MATRMKVKSAGVKRFALGLLVACNRAAAPTVVVDASCVEPVFEAGAPPRDKSIFVIAEGRRSGSLSHTTSLFRYAGEATYESAPMGSCCAPISTSGRRSARPRRREQAHVRAGGEALVLADGVGTTVIAQAAGGPWAQAGGGDGEALSFSPRAG